jgi:hypothetical protein
VDLAGWTFTYPTEFHQVIVERSTAAGDVLQLDLRMQMEDFNNKSRYTFWTTLLYRRLQGAWGFESVTVSEVGGGWRDVRPSVESPEPTPDRPIDARPARPPGRGPQHPVRPR